MPPAVVQEAQPLNKTPRPLMSSTQSPRKNAGTLAHELERLQLVQGFEIIKHMPELDRICRMVARLFHARHVSVKLSNLLHSWTVSCHGNIDLNEALLDSSCRSQYYTQQEQSLWVVPDTAVDPRFDTLALQETSIRFYAEASLVSNGYKIGSLCILDTEPRSQGLERDQEETLQDMADLIVSMLQDARDRLENEKRLEREMACYSHEVMTPLTGLLLSLSSLQQQITADQDCTSCDHTCSSSEASTEQQELLATASNCARDLHRIYQRTQEKQQQEQQPALGTLGQLVECMAPISKHVPLIIQVDPSLPKSPTFENELTVLQVALQLVATACKRSCAGHVKFSIVPGDKQEIVLQCQDSAPALSQHDVDLLFSSTTTTTSPLEDLSLQNLRPILGFVQSFQGRCGYKRLEEGSLFWFSVPVLSWSPQDMADDCPDSDCLFEARHDDMSLTQIILNQGVSPDSVKPHSPKLPSTATADTTTTTLSEGPRQKRALVIDDALVVRKTLARSLSLLGYQVTLAVNGQEGLEQLQKTTFDLVLCDFLMPVMDGLDCISQYREWERQHRSWFRQCIVGISGHASANDRSHAMEAGMDLFHPKPITKQVLQDIVQTTVAQKAAFDLDLHEAFAGLVVDGCTHLEETEDSCSSISPMSHETEDCIEHEYSTAMAHNAHQEPRHCLLTSAEPCILQALNQQGWQCHVVHNSTDVLQGLKQRNWDAVILENTLEGSGAQCVAEFRSWEKMHRFNRQCNIFWLDNDNDVAKDQVWVQLPTGFDGALLGHDLGPLLEPSNGRRLSMISR